MLKVLLLFFVGFFLRVLFSVLEGCFGVFLAFILVFDVFMSNFSLGFFNVINFKDSSELGSNYFNKIYSKNNSSNILRESVAHSNRSFNRSSNVDNNFMDRIRRKVSGIFIEGRKHK
jgi:hypothetical protein